MSRRPAVLGVPVDPVTVGDVLAFARGRIESRLPAQIVTVNVEFVMLAQRDRVFLETLRHAALATPDSAGILWAMRRQGVAVSERVGGSDLIWLLCEQAALHGDGIYFLGGQPGVAEAVAARLVARYPGLRVAGTHGGSPSPEEAAHIVHLVRQSGADLLLVAYGAPEQDVWIGKHLDALGVSVAMGVGGSFDYVAGRAPRAPMWMRERGVEWVFRLATQPWRWRRMLALPRFVIAVLHEQPEMWAGKKTGVGK